MRKPWTLYELTKPIGTPESPYHLSEGEFVFRALPLFASNGSVAPPKGASVGNIWNDYDKSRLAILGGLDWAASQHAHVYQLSLQLLPSPYGENDPLNQMLLRLIDQGRVIVVAAGNSGPNYGTLSDLARIPGVISVGATTPEGRLLDSSSRGSSGSGGPALVCDGTDPWPNPFLPGTSFAAGRVAELCVFLRPVLAWLAREFAARRQQSAWPPGMPGPSRLAMLDTGFDQEEIRRRDTAQRFRFSMTSGGAYTEYVFGSHRARWMDSVMNELPAAGMEFEFDSGPATILRVLRAVATAETCTDPLGCGAGFLSPDELLKQLAELTPSRFEAWFGEIRTPSHAQQQRLETLDHELGPLWDQTTIEFLWHEYLDKADRIYARVL